MRWLSFLAFCAALASTYAHADERTLTDVQGMQYIVLTDARADAESAASGAVFDGRFEEMVSVTTAAGGEISAELADAFDGYAGLALSFVGATGPAERMSGNYVFYTGNGPATFSETTGPCANRELELPAQRFPYDAVVDADAGVPDGGIEGEDVVEVRRRVFVPEGEAFLRWENELTNLGAHPVSLTVGVATNLGSDSRTTISATSSGDDVALLGDLWVASFQAFDVMGRSGDPRLGHVLQGEGEVPVALTALSFVSGDDNPHWWWRVTLAPSQTLVLLEYVTGQPSRAAAASKCAELTQYATPGMFDCMSAIDRARVGNFFASCSGLPNGTECDDRQLCTISDACSAGECVGVPRSCRDTADDCSGVCDPSTGDCIEAPVDDGTPCDDGDLCNGDEACGAGECAATGTPLACDDGLACTDDSCAADRGCDNVLREGCIDCGQDADCDDDNPCNGDERCVDDQCAPGEALDCDDEDDCTQDECVRGTGCSHEPIDTVECTTPGDAGVDASTDAARGSVRGGACAVGPVGECPRGVLTFLFFALLALVRRRSRHP